MMRSPLIAALLSVAAVAQHTPSGCNVLGNPSTSCMMPWPSDHFQAKTWDPSAPPSLKWLTGDTFPRDNAGLAINASMGWNTFTGFSPDGQCIAYLPGLSLDASNLPRLWSIPASVGAAAHSLLLNAATGQAVAHWVELDHSADSVEPPEGYPRATLLWAAGRLNDSTRYIVAYRNLVDDMGIPVQAGDAFAALRDKIPTSNADVEASRPRYEAIFTTLAQFGFARANLTLAWDFTTASLVDITGRMIHMRDDAFSRVAGGASISYVIDKVTENPREGIARQIQGSFSVPVYLNTVAPIPGSVLVLDPTTGLPVFQGFSSFNFTVAIPTSIANGSVAPAQRGFMQYGHGLFGSQSEVAGGYLSDYANANGYVLCAVDEIGLSGEDSPAATVILATDLSYFGFIPDRCQQGLLNELIATKMVLQSAFRNEAVFTFGGAPAVSSDPERHHYYGNSQGGILGLVYMAVSTDVTRGVSGVGGGPYGLLLPRSSDFSELFTLIRLRYARPLDSVAIMATIQMLWTRAEPVGYLHSISGAPLPNTPDHRIILQHGLADAQVNWMGVRYASYSVGAAVFSSNVKQGNESLAHFTNVPDASVLTTGNLAMTFDFGAPSWAAPLIDVPPVNDTWDSHEKPRRDPRAQAQMAEFFKTGRITNTCGGACMPLPPSQQQRPVAPPQLRSKAWVVTDELRERVLASVAKSNAAAAAAATVRGSTSQPADTK